MLDDATRRLVADVVKLATQPGTGELSEQPRHTLDMVALFDRCRGLFGAVRLLVDNGFGQEALILTRPMYTEALMLLEFASANEKRRIELYVRYSLSAIADFEGTLLEAQQRGDTVSRELAAVLEGRASLERYARTHEVRTRRWKPNEKELADKHVGGEGYLDFDMSHHFVHGTAFAGAQRYSARGDVVVVGGPAASQVWAQGAVVSASQSMVFAVRGICGILGWPEPQEVSELLVRIDELAAAARPSGETS